MEANAPPATLKTHVTVLMATLATRVNSWWELIAPLIAVKMESAVLAHPQVLRMHMLIGSTQMHKATSSIANARMELAGSTVTRKEMFAIHSLASMAAPALMSMESPWLIVATVCMLMQQTMGVKLFTLMVASVSIPLPQFATKVTTRVTSA